MSGDIENLILRTVERWWASRYAERHGLVTSYDPKKHLAKVKFMPEGQESGWLPIETNHAGAGFGMLVGLTPGSGDGTGQGGQGQGADGTGGGQGGGQGGQQQGQQDQGDQVIVRYQEGDFESGKIVKVVHSDHDKPPEVQSGEMVMWTKWGQQIFFHKDGSLTFKTGEMPQGSGQQGGQGGDSGASAFGAGSSVGQPGLSSGGQQAKKTSITMDAKGNITTTADKDIKTTATGDITDAATGKMSYTAKKTGTVQAKNSLDLWGNNINLNGPGASVPIHTVIGGGSGGGGGGAA